MVREEQTDTFTDRVSMRNELTGMMRDPDFWIMLFAVGCGISEQSLWVVPLLAAILSFRPRQIGLQRNDGDIEGREVSRPDRFVALTAILNLFFVSVSYFGGLLLNRMVP